MSKDACSFWRDMFTTYFSSGMSPDDDMLFYVKRNPEVKDKDGKMKVPLFTSTVFICMEYTHIFVLFF